VKNVQPIAAQSGEVRAAFAATGQGVVRCGPSLVCIWKQGRSPTPHAWGSFA